MSLTRTKSLWRGLLAVLVALIMTAPLLVGATRPAAANDCTFCHVGIWKGPGIYYGSYKVGPGYVYCVQTGKWYAQGNYTQIGPKDDRDGWKLGYLIDKYGDTADTNTAVAVSMLVPRFAELGNGVRNHQWDTFPDLQPLASELWAEADRNAGPYRIASPQVVTEPTFENGWNVTTQFTVMGGNGAKVADWFGTDHFQASYINNLDNVNVSEVEPGVFNISGHVINSGLWGVNATTVNTAGAGMYWGSDDPKAQAVMSANPIQQSDPTQIGGRVKKQFVPKVSSVTQQVLIQKGGWVSDKVLVEDPTRSEPRAEAGDPISGGSRLYGPFASNQEAMTADVSGLKQVGEVRFEGAFDADGKAVFETNAVRVPADGFYTWVEYLNETEKTVAVSQSIENRPSEMSAALKPAITSKIDADRIAEGGSSSDSVSLSGLSARVGDKDIKWTLTGGLYGPVAPGLPEKLEEGVSDVEAESCKFADYSKSFIIEGTEAEVVLDNSQISAEGTLSLDKAASAENVSSDGNKRCVSWGWSIKGEAPDGTTVSATHAPGDPDQIGVITYNPKISTSATAQVIGPEGGELADNVRVWDGVPGFGFKGRAGLYGPFKTDEEAQRFKLPGGKNPKASELDALKKQAAKVGKPVDQTAKIATGGWYADGDNCYRSVVAEEVSVCLVDGRGSWKDDAAENGTAVDVGPLADGETFADFMKRLYPNADLNAVKPVANEAVAENTDSGEVSEDGSGVAADAPAEIDLGLVVPLEVREFEGRFDENGKATLSVDAVKVTEQGFYVWVEELDQLPNGGEENPPSLERRPPESAVVINPTIATQVSDQSAERGSTITDTAKMTGLVKTIGRKNVGWKAEVLLYGPVAPNPTGGCTDLDWSGADVVARETHEITPDMIGDNGEAVLEKVGAYTIPKYGERGCYTYGELLTATGPDGSTVTVEHKPGNPTQTSLVPYGGMISTGIVPGATILPGGIPAAIAAGALAMLMVGATGEIRARRKVGA